MGTRSLLLLAAAACSGKHPTPQAAPPSAGSNSWTAAVRAQFAMPAWAFDSPTVLRDKINGVNAHVVVLKSSDMAEYRDVLATAEHTPGVVAAESFIFTEDQMAKGSGAPVPVAVKGVDPARVSHVLTIGQHMVAGSMDALAATTDPPPVILGDTLAGRLGAKIGEDVTVTAPASDDGWTTPQPAHTKTFRVAGTFHMDFDEYDNRLVLAPLTAMQALLDRGDQVMGIEMTVRDVDHAGDVAVALETALGGPPYQAMDWYELNKQLFTALFGDKRP